MRDYHAGVQFGKGRLGRVFVGRVADGVPEVVIDTEEVDITGYNVHIAVLHRRKLDAAPAVMREQVLRILAVEQRVEIEPVRLPVHASDRLYVGLAVA